MLLLSAIALFSPDSPNVVHRDVVKLEQVSASVCNHMEYRHINKVEGYVA